MGAFIDHISIPVADFDRSAAFYDAVLSTLGLIRRKQSLAPLATVRTPSLHPSSGFSHARKLARRARASACTSVFAPLIAPKFTVFMQPRWLWAGSTPARQVNALITPPASMAALSSTPTDSR
jgi:catechol 2,3-dioxygenase-like lactoylglutathione lyase family enzyme